MATKIEDFKDLVIRWDGHQKYRSDKIIENELIEIIVQKLEMVLFTGENEVFGEESDGFGTDLEMYLWETNVSNDILKGIVVQNINQWIPELNLIGYDLEISIYEGTVRDIMELNFIILGYNVDLVWS